MYSKRLNARRRILQQQMKKANDRICKNGNDLKKAFKVWVDAAHEDGLLAFMAALSGCYARLVQRTPMDTGRARAGWHIEDEVNEWKPDFGIRYDIAARIREELSKLPSLIQADVVYIMSNIEYILPLEAGWSVQSSGFWALFIEELGSQLEQAAANSRKGTP